MEDDDFLQFARELESVRKNEVTELEIILGKIRMLKAETTKSHSTDELVKLTDQIKSAGVGLKNRLVQAESYGLGNDKTVKEAKSVLRAIEKLHEMDQVAARAAGAT